MNRVLAYLKNPWVVILLLSVGVFTFWGGPVFTAQSLNHGGRLVASYLVIPVGVSVVLLWRKSWSLVNWGYLTIGLALIKMMITMGVHLWVIPRGARVESKPIARAMSAPAAPAYSTDTTSAYGRIAGTMQFGSAAGPCIVALVAPASGKPPATRAHTLTIRDSRLEPDFLQATVNDSLVVVNQDSIFHTFSLGDSTHQFFQVPLLPNQTSQPRTLPLPGFFHSSCAHAHPGERLRAIVFAHPYHVQTGGHGGFAMDSVPPGDHTLGVWCIGDQSGDPWSRPDTSLIITVRSGEETTVRVAVAPAAGGET